MKKTRIKLDSENSLFIKTNKGTYLYEIVYDSCLLVENDESEEKEQEYCVMIYYNGETLLLQSVVSKKTIEEKFSLILNKGIIAIYSDELIYVNSSNPKVKLL